MNLRNPAIIKTAGPGILFASAAVGTSHLIQSTRAGAEFGLIVLALAVAVLVLRYPFFEYGLRYATQQAPASSTDTGGLAGQASGCSLRPPWQRCSSLRTP